MHEEQLLAFIQFESTEAEFSEGATIIQRYVRRKSVKRVLKANIQSPESLPTGFPVVPTPPAVHGKGR